MNRASTTHVRAAERAGAPSRRAALGVVLTGLVCAASCDSTPIEARKIHPKLTSVVAAEEAYKVANCGYYDRDLRCLGAPWDCIPGYSRAAPAFLDATQEPYQGEWTGWAGGIRFETWELSLRGGPAPSPLGARCSPSSATSFAYTAERREPHTVICADSKGQMVFTVALDGAEDQAGEAPILDARGLCAKGDAPGISRFAR
jgi:hypothetical protein